MIVGVEVGKNGTPHLQGYFRRAKKMRFNAVKKMLGPCAHIEQARGSELQNDEYCRKNGVIAVEIGTMNGSVGEKGCSSATSDTVRMLIEMRADGITLANIAAGAHILCYMKYAKQIETIANKIKLTRNINGMKTTYPDVLWRVWQLKLIELAKPTNPKKVVWYVDETGNSGKTFLIKYLLIATVCDLKMVNPQTLSSLIMEYIVYLI